MTYQPVCPEEELPAGSRRIVTLGPVTVGVFNVAGT
jgi:hypothetical protein